MGVQVLWVPWHRTVRYASEAMCNVRGSEKSKKNMSEHSDNYRYITRRDIAFTYID